MARSKPFSCVNNLKNRLSFELYVLLNVIREFIYIESESSSQEEQRVSSKVPSIDLGQ